MKKGDVNGFQCFLGDKVLYSIYANDGSKIVTQAFMFDLCQYLQTSETWKGQKAVLDE